MLTENGLYVCSTRSHFVWDRFNRFILTLLAYRFILIALAENEIETAKHIGSWPTKSLHFGMKGIFDGG